MAKTSAPKGAEAPANGKGQPKPQAILDTLDFSTALDESALASAPRQSKWIKLLDSLYDATVAENSKVPRNEAGDLMFVKLGSFSNVNGARTQARSLEQKGLNTTFEFKSTTRADGSDLYGRVIETADAAEG